MQIASTLYCTVDSTVLHAIVMGVAVSVFRRSISAF